MDKEYLGIFTDRSKEGILRKNCRIVLEEDRIMLYFLGKNGVKFREFKADSIFSFEDEKLITIDKPVNLSLEVLCTLLGTLLLPVNWIVGLMVIGLSFMSTLKKPTKSYILLCKPIAQKRAELRLLKICGIKSKTQKSIFKAA